MMKILIDYKEYEIGREYYTILDRKITNKILR
jgi:hypothetical protein